MATRTTVTRARPVEYSHDLAIQICAEIASGRSLKRICERDAGMPHRATVFKWMQENEGFLKLYNLAKAESADAHAEDIEDIAEDVRNGKLDPNAGRVAMDAYKWTASKLKPKKYGDKLDLTSGGDKLPTPIYGGLSADTGNQTDGDTGA